LNAQRPVVPEACDTAVYLARLEDEPAAPAQGDQLLHVHDVPRQFLDQRCLTIPTAPTSTRSGSRRSSGTRANWSTWAAALMSSSYPRARRLAPPLLTSSAPSKTRPWFSKQSHARRALSLRHTSWPSHRKSTSAPARSVSSRV